MIAAARLRVDAVELFNETVANDVCYMQQPAAGEQIAAGSNITMFINRRRHYAINHGIALDSFSLTLDCGQRVCLAPTLAGDLAGADGLICQSDNPSVAAVRAVQ